MSDRWSVGRVMAAAADSSAQVAGRRLVLGSDDSDGSLDSLLGKVGREDAQRGEGAIDRAVCTHRPRLTDVDWNRPIAKDLKHYLPEHRTVPERLVGHGTDDAMSTRATSEPQ